MLSTLNTAPRRSPTHSSILRLRLKAETIRTLTTQELHLVVGGICDAASLQTHKVDEATNPTC
jgi:hypothetical protein